MPLSVFSHATKSHYREVMGERNEFGHLFGGTARQAGIYFRNSAPIHLLYRLNLADLCLGLNLPQVSRLPLCYHFSYATYDGTLLYRVINDREIEVIAPKEVEFDPDFPSPGYPQGFPEVPLIFERLPYNSRIAESALELAALFGLDGLPESELQRAVVIAEESSKTISDCDFPDWTDEEKLRLTHRQPFMQGAPLKHCTNPVCTSDVAYRQEEVNVPIDPEFQYLLGTHSLTMEAHDVREDSMRVFAIHNPGSGHEPLSCGLQLVFEICQRCCCIRVSNQCG